MLEPSKGRERYSWTFDDAAYQAALVHLSDAYHDAYLTAAAQDEHIAGVAAAGDAWSRAWQEGNRKFATGISLTFNYQPGSQPSPVNKPADAGFHHPSNYGAHLNGHVLFEKITGTDVCTFGGSEQSASSLGISPAIAMQLQQVAWESVTQQSNQLVQSGINSCK
jgi:hypothetical protein